MPTPPTIAVIVVAAGTGARMGGLPKQYRPLAGTPVLARTLAAFLGRDDIALVLPVVNPAHLEAYAALGLASPKLLPAVGGAATRQGSVLAGLEALAPHQPDLVLIHDAARPLVEAATISGVIAALGEAALPVLPVTDTIKRSEDGRTVAGTEDRRQLFAAQTPQGFAFAPLLDAHRRAADEPTEFTDDAAIAEWAGMTVTLTAGSGRNIKLTHPEDFARAERLLLGDKAMETRTGTGFDVHAFVPGDAVWLGGVRIPHSAKLDGHSDADAPLHALTDALYGALGEGDIGSFFPPSDPKWKGAASTIFLAHAAKLVAERGGRIVNLDITIVAEAPKIGPHVAAMKAVIAETCGIVPGRIAIKATTSENMGFVGRREGITSLATATIELPRED